MHRPRAYPASRKFVNLPPRVYNVILSDEGVGVLDIIHLKQICRLLRERLKRLLADYPEIYRGKLVLLAEKIPTGLPEDLSTFTSAQLEAAALRSYAVEQAWRTNSPRVSGTQTYHPSTDPTSDRLKVMALKVLPGGRWVVSALESGCITVWDTAEKRIVAQDFRCETISAMALEIIRQDYVRIALTCYLFDHNAEAMTPALAVYSLNLDSTPRSRQDGALNLIGNVWSRERLINPAIKGPLAGAISYNQRESVNTLVYNWREKTGNVLKVDPRRKGDEFGIAQSLVFLPGQVLLYRRWDHLASIVAFNIPNLGRYTFDKDNVHSPTVINVVPGSIYKWDVKPGGDKGTSRCNVLIAETSSCPRSMSFVTLIINAYEPRGIFCESMDLTFDPALEYPPVRTTLDFKRKLGSGSRHISLRKANPHRPLFALGHSGKRAIWVEYSLDRGHGGLLGFTNLVEGSTESIESYELNDMQETQVFRGAYPLRRLPTSGIESLATDITAIGFDETTGVVALGDLRGQVSIFNYGPSIAGLGEDDSSEGE